MGHLALLGELLPQLLQRCCAFTARTKSIGPSSRASCKAATLKPERLSCSGIASALGATRVPSASRSGVTERSSFPDRHVDRVGRDAGRFCSAIRVASRHVTGSGSRRAVPDAGWGAGADVPVRLVAVAGAVTAGNHAAFGVSCCRGTRPAAAGCLRCSATNPQISNRARCNGGMACTARPQGMKSGSRSRAPSALCPSRRAMGIRV